MGNKWILDVLTDLQTFAAQNDLPELATRLEETALIAGREIMGQGHEGWPFVMTGEKANARRVLSEVGAG